jgi:dephospho-CoA kinase
MLLVGLTGGVASGKSTVSRILREEGAYIIDADQIAKELVTPDSPVSQELVRVFGRDILQQDGSVDRKKLAARIFLDPEQRNRLNGILHPRIRETICERVRRIVRSDPGAIVIVDAALLIEVGWHREVDEVIVVTSSAEQQIDRLGKRDGLAPEQAERILAAQMAQEEKVKVADFIISNEGALEETIRKTREVFDKLKKTAHGTTRKQMDHT